VGDIRLFSTFAGLLIGFFAGELIPLDILPGFLKKVSLALPFQYTLYFPIKIYQGLVLPKEMILALVICLSWIITICVLISWLWQKGVKQYEAVGQ